MPTIQVRMPQLGESVVEGTISKWLKREGDPVQEFEPLLEVNTDKVDTEVPAPAAGVVLKLLVEPGVTVRAGTPIALIGAAETEPEPAAAANGHRHPPAEDLPPAASRAAHRELGFISPVVAKLAEEYAVDLHLVAGSGLGGRITKKDVLGYLETRQGGVSAAPVPAASLPAASLPAAAPEPAEVEPAAPPAPPARPPAPVASPAPAADETVMRVDGLRLMIAEHMV
nr:E3 binding domain-containing protein [Anaerolineales bacterium]